MTNKFETDVTTPYGVVTVQHDGTLSNDQLIALAKKERLETEVQTPSGTVVVEHGPAASKQDLLFLARQQEKQQQSKMPEQYEEPKGDVASDVAQVLLKASEAPMNAVNDFFVNPLLTFSCQAKLRI